MKHITSGTILVTSLLTSAAFASDVYGPYPITLKGYNGDATNSVAYSGQVGRQLLHNSLKKAISNGAPMNELKAYFNGSDTELPLLDPVSSADFKHGYLSGIWVLNRQIEKIIEKNTENS